MKNWIWPVTPINWPVVKEKKVWAVDTRGKGERVVKGDHIIFYVNKSRCFQGIFEVASDWHEPTVTWPDSKQAFPVSEIDLKPIQLGYANFRKLIDKLEFIESKKSVGLYLRGTPHGPANSAKPISNHDYQLLLSELEQVQEKPYEDKSKESLDVEEFIPVTSWSFISERIHELPTPNLKSIDSIINDIKNGKYAIPIFQREYTWKRKQIEELWESIFQGFFVGSILTWDSDEQLATISVHGAPNLSNTYDIVLDGQQRITSLFYAVTTPDIALPDNHSMRFFVDLKALLDPNASSSDIIFSERTGRAEKLGYLDMNKQFEKKIFPLDAFNSRNYAFWITSFKTYLEKVEGLDGTESENYYREILSILDHVWFQYKIPVVQLPKSLSLDSVAEVFEKINSKGTRLGVFDLLNARFTSYDVSLRTIWDQAKSNYDNIKKLNREIDDAEKYILQGMALFKKGHIRRKELLNLNNSYIELKIFHKEAFLADWLKLCKHTSKAITHLESQRESGFGAVKFSIIPYTVTIPILSALMYKIEEREDRPKCMNKIQNWYWSVAISDNYSGSTDSKIEKDYREILQWFDDDNDAPEIVLEQRQRFDSLSFNSTKANDSVYRAILCLISKNGASDFVTAEPPEYGALDIHHIFPKSKEKEYYGNTSINSILNKTLLNSDTNRKYIRDKKPKTYLKEIIERQSIDEIILRKRLKTHLISDEAFDCLLQDNFDGFVQARKETIREALRELIMPIVSSSETTIEKLLHSKESQRLEYKSSMRWDMKLKQQNNVLEEVIAKELCCFMNSGGGDLLMGVDDDGNPIGLEKDYSTFRDKGSDGFSQHVTNIINKYLGKNANPYVELYFIPVNNSEICHCKVKPSPWPIYFSSNNKKKFFIRTNNSCQPLDTEEAHNYISKHWN